MPIKLERERERERGNIRFPSHDRIGTSLVTTATEAAGLVDEYLFIHKSWPGEPVQKPVLHSDGGRSLFALGVLHMRGLGKVERMRATTAVMKATGRQAAQCVGLRSIMLETGG